MDDFESWWSNFVTSLPGAASLQSQFQGTVTQPFQPSAFGTEFQSGAGAATLQALNGEYQTQGITASPSQQAGIIEMYQANPTMATNDTTVDPATTDDGGGYLQVAGSYWAPVVQSAINGISGFFGNLVPDAPNLSTLWLILVVAGLIFIIAEFLHR